ncbi:hypothetical protein EUV02_15195 [Polymorphobacter arshaanensis]|uniref:Immunity protein 27 of polymorphic toxin system n=1 Tax=Glacieibacterium arshaanense TaxID=2511025 RepID=A0A4Y9EL24_9SPHN|nr:Imm27 family immunity protein [Polymorphobacter arshaanensis]TFU00389.1 hypothetical protein EUV02_15195 [Polymorphobacter arshaanensis]
MMDPLLPHEIELTGKWIALDGDVQGDAVCERIDYLTEILDVVQDHPQAGGWRRLFRDPADGRYWELTYPQAELHAGGPPALRWISDDEMKQEYGFSG